MRPLDLFFDFYNMDRWTDQQAYFPIEMQFYISAMFIEFIGFPDEIHEEKPSFLDFENNWLRTDGPTDGRTDRPSYRDARTHLKSGGALIRVGALNMDYTVNKKFYMTSYAQPLAELCLN